jgi:hypothetical protein
LSCSNPTQGAMKLRCPEGAQMAHPVCEARMGGVEGVWVELFESHPRCEETALSLRRTAHLKKIGGVDSVNTALRQLESSGGQD